MPDDINNKQPDKLIGKAINLNGKPIKLFEKIQLMPRLGKKDPLLEHLKNVRKR